MDIYLFIIEVELMIFRLSKEEDKPEIMRLFK